MTQLVSIGGAVAAVKRELGLAKELDALAACDAAREMLGMGPTPASLRLKGSLQEVIELLHLGVTLARIGQGAGFMRSVTRSPRFKGGPQGGRAPA